MEIIKISSKNTNNDLHFPMAKEKRKSMLRTREEKKKKKKEIRQKEQKMFYIYIYIYTENKKMYKHTLLVITRGFYIKQM